MKKLILILAIGFVASIGAKAQAPAADFDLNILMSPASVPLNNMGTVQVSVCNDGNRDIVANSIRVTVSMGPNGEIVGLETGSDSRWTILSLGSGSGNTIILKNTGGTMTQILGANPCANIGVKIKAKVEGGPNTITGTIGYINDLPAGNPLLGPGIPSASQGNSSTANDNSNTSLIVTPNSTLPLTLLDFTGKLVNNNRVDLNWNTATEIDINRFVVERSLDGINYTANIATVNARGGNSSYAAQDLQPYAGANYYRLKIYENSGSFHYSNVVLVNLKTKMGVTVYPSPSPDGNVNASFSGYGRKNVILNDIAGRQVKVWSNYDNSTLRIEGLVSGTYILSVIDIATGFREVQKFTVNR